jgi:hypothetical protein
MIAQRRVRVPAVQAAHIQESRQHRAASQSDRAAPGCIRRVVAHRAIDEQRCVRLGHCQRQMRAGAGGLFLHRADQDDLSRHIQQAFSQFQQDSAAGAVIKIGRTEALAEIERLRRIGDRGCDLDRGRTRIDVNIIGCAVQVARARQVLRTDADQPGTLAAGCVQAHRRAGQRLQIDAANRHDAERTIAMDTLHQQPDRVEVRQHGDARRTSAVTRNDVAEPVDLDVARRGRQRRRHAADDRIFMAGEAGNGD